MSNIDSDEQNNNISILLNTLEIVTSATQKLLQALGTSEKPSFHHPMPIDGT